MNIEILFENENYLVINKPSGLVVHSDGKTDEPTVVDWVLENYPEINGVGENMVTDSGEINRPGIIHRIDRDTSGCLVIAKNQSAFNYLKDQFKNRSVKKQYQALTYGWIKNDEGEIDEPIGRSSKDFRMKSAGRSARGQLRDAQTEYTVVGRYYDETKKDKQGQFEKYTLVECRPKTGRTHQIRVHLKWLNHPIVSDPLYSGKRKPALGLDRTALHAQSISFLGLGGERVVVEAPLPADMHSAIDSLRKKGTDQ
jgi:23S rRNA pseudouridine1911/1915/1917 synthase